MNGGSFVHHFVVESDWYPVGDELQFQHQRVAQCFSLRAPTGHYEVAFSRTGHNLGLAEARSLGAAWKIAVAWIERAALPPGVSDRSCQ